jgi:hypothetical protein
MIWQSDGLAVRADNALLARTWQSTRNRALARHRCLTALLETSRQGRKWLGILHASAIGVAGRCVNRLTYGALDRAVDWALSLRQTQ